MRPNEKKKKRKGKRLHRKSRSGDAADNLDSLKRWLLHTAPYLCTHTHTGGGGGGKERKNAVKCYVICDNVILQAFCPCRRQAAQTAYFSGLPGLGPTRLRRDLFSACFVIYQGQNQDDQDQEGRLKKKERRASYAYQNQSSPPIGWFGLVEYGIRSSDRRTNFYFY